MVLTYEQKLRQLGLKQVTRNGKTEIIKVGHSARIVRPRHPRFRNVWNI